jgi:hypothetical protein
VKNFVDRGVQTTNRKLYNGLVQKYKSVSFKKKGDENAKQICVEGIGGFYRISVDRK